MVYGIGYLGEGIFRATVKGKQTKVYSVWKDMLKRCYSEKYQEKFPSYVGCIVHPDWHNFQNFADWYCKESHYGLNSHLDKDILVKGNKIYASFRCCLIPASINLLVVNSRAKRGLYPLGVRKNNYNFQATCKNGDKVVIIGNYKTPELAFYAYKAYKENLIREISLKSWKENLISKSVLDALLNWRIEITD